MAATEDPDSSRGPQRPKSSVFKSFMHKRNNSAGGPNTTTPCGAGHNWRGESGEAAVDMGLVGFPRNAQALGELQQNQQDQAPRSPKKSKGEVQDGQKSPKKSGFGTLSLKSQAGKDAAKLAKGKESSPEKPKKVKSSTNLAGLLSRPKSLKNLHRLASDDGARPTKDKENRSPPDSLGTEPAAPPPIYAQFCSDTPGQRQTGVISPCGRLDDPFTAPDAYPGQPSNESLAYGLVLKQRPKSFHPPYVGRHESSPSIGTATPGGKKSKKDGSESQRSSTWGRKDKTSRSKTSGAFPGSTPKSKHQGPDRAGPSIDHKDIDSHLEAMLDRRNIPENQRYKMRNLADTIKMEFIRQDWAETQAKSSERPRSHDSDTSTEGPAAGSDQGKPKTKHSRVKSLTLSKGGSNKAPSSPTKKRPEGTLGRHFRSKSTDSVASDTAPSPGPLSSSSIFSKIKTQQTPNDFVSYLRKVPKPELVEVGKLHKLRLLLRNETVAWTEDFIRQGGMQEIVGLLHRIMKVEWREEHEDALLHENLLCLKALCTTALALQYLHSIQATLFPALIHMIFDPEKKGPSEFTTRNIITSVLFTYIQSATPVERVGRAQTVLNYLRDPEGKEEERPVSFVLEMRRERPYRVWCKEAVSVTKEVFWIFLHNLNVVALPTDRSTKGGQPLEPHAASGGQVGGPAAQPPFMIRHFPQERPPVPAAPYVGGVEWDATNYLASHLDLMNAIMASTPTAAARNALRDQLRISGWERCLGGSLRLCKEKFYGAVHDGLRTWVGAAYEDGWDVKDVRYGPPADPRSPPKKCGGGGGGGGNGARKMELAPRLEMPKLDFALGPPLAPGAGAGAGAGQS